jgi:Putative MetA-pathway of phenol degradation
MKKLILFILIAFFSKQLSAQQAWTRAKGSYFAQIGWTPDNYDGIIPNGGGKVVLANRDFSKTTLDAYLEYGITDKLMVTSSVPFVIGKSTKTSGVAPVGLLDGSINGFSNIEVGLTYNFIKSNGFVLSGKINTALPTASVEESTGLRTGNSALAIEPSLLVGYGHSKFFASADIGFGYRTNNYSSQTLLNAQIGKVFGKKQKLILILNSVNRVSRKNGSLKDTNNQYTGFFLNNLSYVVIGLKAGYKITPNLMIWGNARSTSPGGVPENIGEPSNPLPAFSLSISYQM